MSEHQGTYHEALQVPLKLGTHEANSRPAILTTQSKHGGDAVPCKPARITETVVPLEPRPEGQEKWQLLKGMSRKGESRQKQPHLATSQDIWPHKEETLTLLCSKPFAGFSNVWSRVMSAPFSVSSLSLMPLRMRARRVNLPISTQVENCKI